MTKEERRELKKSKLSNTELGWIEVPNDKIGHYLSKMTKEDWKQTAEYWKMLALKWKPKGKTSVLKAPFFKLYPEIRGIKNEWPAINILFAKEKIKDSKGRPLVIEERTFFTLKAEWEDSNL